MQIDRYEFGLIVIEGQTFRNDVLIWPGRIKGDWWRKEGHLLQLDDVAEALAAYLRDRGVALMAYPTREACRVINDLSRTRRLAAALHLTC